MHRNGLEVLGILRNQHIADRSEPGARQPTSTSAVLFGLTVMGFLLARDP